MNRQPFYIRLITGHPGDVAAPVDPQPASREIVFRPADPVAAPPSFNEADFGDKPALIRDLAPRSDGSRRDSAMTFSPPPPLESLRSVDDGWERSCGAAAERKAGAYLRLPALDHGLFLGEHRYDWGKFMPIRIPASPLMAVRGPE